MLGSLSDFPDGLLVPIPTTPGRARLRGYNQAERIAAELARMSGRRMLPNLLERRSGGSQIGLQPHGRAANLRGAFSLSRAESVRVRGGHIVLIDDVLTTGSTAAEAARVLTRAGAARVGVVAFARALPDQAPRNPSD